jgi:hypothetical protein
MPRFIIERQYLVPVYEHILVEAPSLEAACLSALDDINHPWGDDAKVDYESARSTTIERAVEIPGYPGLDVDECSPAHLLYDAGLDALPIPAEFADCEEAANKVGFV